MQYFVTISKLANKEQESVAKVDFTYRELGNDEVDVTCNFSSIINGSVNYEAVSAFFAWDSIKIPLHRVELLFIEKSKN